MFGVEIQQRIRSIMEQIVRPVAERGLSPNVVSLLGLLFTGVAATVLGIGQLHWGGALILSSGIFDMFDGAVARVQKRTTKFGAFLDSTIDRYAEGLLFLGLIFHAMQSNRLSTSWMWIIVLAYCSAIFSLVVSYTRARAEGLGYECKVGLMERPERIILLGSGLLIGGETWLIWILGILAVTTGLTGIQRIVHVWRVSQTS
jgi:CDP-diacylglycerol--glycerol-3-phosphate 3-phosphatidyltransferase